MKVGASCCLGVRRAKACEELKKLQAKVQAIPASELRRLAVEEKDLVSQTNEAWAEVTRRHTQYPSFPEADWPRLEEAFRICRELNSALASGDAPSGK